MTYLSAAISRPTRLAQPVEHVGMVLRPMPGYAIEDIFFKNRRRTRDSLFERFLCFLSTSKLAERGSEPAVRKRKIGIRAEPLSRGLDRSLVVTAKILADDDCIEFKRSGRIARIES